MKGRGQRYKLCGYVWLKLCGGCSTWVEPSGYNKNIGMSDGLQNYCRPCHRAANQKWRRDNEELNKELKRKWRIRKKEHRKEYQKTWKNNNPDYFTNWAKDNPERIREHKNRRRALKRNATVGKVNYKEIMRRDDMICHICGGKVNDVKELHFDHVIPLCRDGEHSMDNIKVSHDVCNMRKGSKLMEEMV